MISTALSGGRLQLCVLADEAPDGFEAAVPDLEDVYFATLDAHGIEAAV